MKFDGRSSGAPGMSKNNPMVIYGLLGVVIIGPSVFLAIAVNAFIIGIGFVVLVAAIGLVFRSRKKHEKKRKAAYEEAKAARERRKAEKGGDPAAAPGSD